MRIERIGSATLYLGDARDVCATLDPVDFIFTDPPYGHNNNDGDLIERRESALGRPPKERAKQVKRPIANDGAGASDLARWLFAEAGRLLKPGCCCCCCCCGGGPDPQFARWSLWMDELLGFKQMVIWDKGPMGMGWHYRRSYETVLVGEKPGAACHWYDETNAIENVIRPGQFGIRKILPPADGHPTPKAWQMAAWFMQLHTRPGDVVLDPFMGGGSTVEAALRTGRSIVGVEIAPEWFDLACRNAEAAIKQRDLFIEAPVAEDPADARIADLFAEPAK